MNERHLRTWEDLGGRVAFARRAAGFTQEELGRRIGINRSGVARIEAGQRQLDALELARLAEALGRSVAWFVSPAPPMVASHRRTQAEDEGVVQLEDELETAARDLQLLADINELPAPEVGAFDADIETFDDAENAARVAREQLDEAAGPLRDLQGIAERFGLYAFSLDLGPDVIDGAYVRVGDFGAAIVNGRMDSGRRRFNLAHELGHHLLADEYTTDFAIGEPKEGRERLINAFAIHFLAPREALLPRWEQLCRASDDRSALIRIAAEFRLSWSAACSQVRNVGLVDANRRAVLEQRRPTSVDYVELEVGFDEELVPPAVPRGFAQAALRAYRNHKIAEERTLELLRSTIASGDLPPARELPLDALRPEFANESS